MSGVYMNMQDGQLYLLRWAQRVLTSPAQLEAIAYNQPSLRVIQDVNRIDFVTLSPEALRRPPVPPVDPASSPMGVDE